MGSFLLVHHTVLCFCPFNAGDLSNLFHEAQVLLLGQAVAHTRNSYKEYLEDGLRRTQGYSINSWFKRQEGLPTDPARVPL